MKPEPLDADAVNGAFVDGKNEGLGDAVADLSAEIGKLKAERDAWRNRHMETAGKLDAAEEGLRIANLALGTALEKLGGTMVVVSADLARVQDCVVLGRAQGDTYTFTLSDAPSGGGVVH